MATAAADAAADACRTRALLALACATAHHEENQKGKCVCAHLVKHAPDCTAWLVNGCNNNMPIVTGHAFEETHHSESSKAVQTTCGLIQEHNRRCRNDASSNGQPLALATAQATQQQASWQRTTNHSPAHHRHREGGVGTTAAAAVTQYPYGLVICTRCHLHLPGAALSTPMQQPPRP